MYVNLAAVLIDHAGGFVELLQAVFAPAVLVDDRVRTLELTESRIQSFVLHTTERCFDFRRTLRVRAGA